MENKKKITYITFHLGIIFIILSFFRLDNLKDLLKSLGINYGLTEHLSIFLYELLTILFIMLMYKLINIKIDALLNCTLGLIIISLIIILIYSLKLIPLGYRLIGELEYIVINFHILLLFLVWIIMLISIHLVNNEILITNLTKSYKLMKTTIYLTTMLITSLFFLFITLFSILSVEVPQNTEKKIVMDQQEYILRTNQPFLSNNSESDYYMYYKKINSIIIKDCR